MAKQHTSAITTLSLLFLLLVALPLSSSAARLLIAAKNVDIELPRGNDASSGVVLSCDNNAAVGASGRAGLGALRGCGRRGQMLLSMLPKGGGPVPPSAPSRRTNGNNN